MEHSGQCLDSGRMQSFQLQPSFSAWQSLVTPHHHQLPPPLYFTCFSSIFYLVCVHERENMKAWNDLQHVRLNMTARGAASVSTIHFVAASWTKIDRLWKRSCTFTGGREQVGFAACLACCLFPLPLLWPDVKRSSASLDIHPSFLVLCSVGSRGLGTGIWISARLGVISAPSWLPVCIMIWSAEV